MDNRITELNQLVSAIEAGIRAALSTRSAESFETLEQQVNRCNGAIRELIQSRRAKEAQAAIARLEGRDELTEDDRDTLRMLLIGDAQAWLKHENNLGDWLQELERLSAQIQSLSAGSDEEVISDLRGVVMDAARLLPAIRSYLEEKERVEHFNAAITKLEASDRQLLAQLLRDMMSASTR